MYQVIGRVRQIKDYERQEPTFRCSHRRCIVLGFWCLMAAAMGPNGQTLALAQGPGTISNEIRAAEAARFRAMTRNDLGALDTLLGADLSYTHTSGERQGKAEFESVIRSGALTYLSAEPDSVVVRVYGPTAIADGRARMHVRAEGRELSFSIRFLEVYARRRGRWELVAWQSTRLPASGT